MKNYLEFLIVDTYYPKFLSSLYERYPELREKEYSDQLEFIKGQCFGTGDFYSKNLKKLGCEAEDIIPNCNVLQNRWAVENGLKAKNSVLVRAAKRLPYIRRCISSFDWSLKVLEAQIKKAMPDVLYMQDLSFCPPSFLDDMKEYVTLVVGQIACPLPTLNYLKPYNLILTSFPHYVDRFRKLGINSEYFKIAFEPSVLERTGRPERIYACTFVGGISPAHKKGTDLLEELARHINIDFFGYGAETLDRNSPIIPKHHGEVWGLNMYKVLLSSRITINRHIDVAENYANNMRLYEATGCGAMLITDYKDNLNELFKVGREVIAYRDVDELIKLIKYYMKNDEEQSKIAENGQKRTMTEHNYFQRMGELIDIIDKYI